MTDLTDATAATRDVRRGIVTNISDLSPAMRELLRRPAEPDLPAEATGSTTADALRHRGLISLVSLNPLVYRLTDAGKRCRDALERQEAPTDTPKFGGAHRRRAERRGHKPRVTVVTLRRTSAKGIEGARGPLEERHRVRRHPRTYWVGTGADRHKEVRYIESHWSPADLSLPEAPHTEKVYSFRR